MLQIQVNCTFESPPGDNDNVAQMSGSSPNPLVINNFSPLRMLRLLIQKVAGGRHSELCWQHGQSGMNDSLVPIFTVLPIASSARCQEAVYAYVMKY